MKEKNKKSTVKCNKGSTIITPHTNQQYSISVDWLEMVFTGEISSLMKGSKKAIINKDLILLLDNKQEHPSFTFSYIILYKNINFGHLFYGNNNKYRFNGKVTCQLRVENQRFYERNFLGKLNTIISNLKLSLFNYYRIDIAIDSAGLLQQANYLLGLKAYSRKKEVETSVVLDSTPKKYKKINIGSRFSDHQISIYPKSKYEDKPYISNFWADNNLAMPNKDVSRLELRLRSKSIKKININFNELENPHYLVSIVKSKVEPWLTFIHKTEKKNVKHLIDWDQFDHIEVKKKRK